ncbi:hypothetical protein [uncultured Desulfovibrio sp.]|uniref:rolling circle replication-associated protein n=1 Tax=uncultured Desulfovibrio sp. TaxID=167968 RepID=UPI0028044696|nr:hypothetical protein [uncultured Desulfovibrio sp.]
MLCRNPFIRDPTGKVFRQIAFAGRPLEDAVQGIPFPCGQCLPCLINKRRLWTHRLLLEAMCHERAAFITLTFREEDYPSDGSVQKRDVQLWIKRLRKLASPRKLRYYAVGEYGALTHRAHYHAIVFGIDTADIGLVEQSWPFGHVFVAECNRLTIQYVVGYVTKKMVRKDDGIQKEFAVMSRRPGLGFDSVVKLSGLIRDPKYAHLFQWDSSIPDGLRHGRMLMPFDRFIKDKLCKILEYDVDSTAFYKEMMYKFWKARSANPDYYHPLLDILLSESHQRFLQIKAKHKIFCTRNSI